MSICEGPSLTASLRSVLSPGTFNRRNEKNSLEKYSMNLQRQNIYSTYLWPANYALYLKVRCDSSPHIGGGASDGLGSAVRLF